MDRSEDRAAARRLLAMPCGFDSIDRETWDALVDRNPMATPFARWAFQRAWWDAFGANAHDQTLLLGEAGLPAIVAKGALAASPVAIAPLMHRHQVEPSDEESRTKMRHASGPALTPVAPTAKAVFMAASYHADYATFLAAPGDLEAVAEAVVDELARPRSIDPDHPAPWDVVDLRRLRCSDPTSDALVDAFRRRGATDGWTVELEREDVCPVVTLPDPPATLDDYLGMLGKKERHEVRRKLRRARAAGELRFTESSRPLDDLETFIDLHQRKWGADGLFPPTVGGSQSRVFFRRLFELFGPDGELRLGFLTLAGKPISAGIWFDDGQTIYYYNAGVDPAAKPLSPGVLLVAMLADHAIALGRRRLDFLRGDEPYKYEWGAVDEPIQRLLVRRNGN